MLFNILLYQILLMVCYMIVGFWLFKRKIITEQGCSQLGKILLYVVLPAAIMKSCIKTFSEELFLNFIYSLIASIIVLGVSVLISYVVFKRKYPIENFSAAFSNAGFIGIPLIKGALGDEAVFFAASFIALLNILQWTYGVYVMSGNKDNIKLKKIVQNPIVISFLLGILLFIMPFSIPHFVQDVLGGLAAMNGPLAMIILGIYAAQLNKNNLYVNKQILLCSFLRIIFIPLITIIILFLMPNMGLDIKMAIIIAAAAPVGSNVAIFSQLEGLDYTEAVKNVCLSTILSIVTLPVIVSLAQYLWLMFN